MARLRVDRDVAARAGRAPRHEPARVQRPREQPAAVQGEGHRARAVVARVAERGVPAAVAVRLVGDPVGRGDHPAHGVGQRAAPPAAAAARRGALEHHLDARVPQRPPRGGADHAVRAEPAAALEALDRPGGRRAEDAVGREAEPPLQQRDAPPLGRPAAVAARPARGLAAARPAAAEDRAPCDAADDAVGGEAVAALEALDGADRRRAEDAVGGEAQLALELRDAAALVAALEGLGVRRRDRQQEHERADRQERAQGSRGDGLLHDVGQSFADRSSGRLRGELTGSR
ncbi:MAG: hypothetical protein AVDCRST_MAG30-2163 [uncultured Solirubrobacteraceae bacterium]|uniref:Uncharacterized protein n=1 Tax=uncultured Solirubrobacteraceae bacterium TaxID=1162706 RepID=A0A6J4STZ5_9ACTN|nr:MAG: hypothetical protein AVDCRST_MAG30-2163 [uncultured Solirubrobacteraceae bacterium]